MSEEHKTAVATTDPAAVKQKKCSMCGEDIQQTAKRCKECKSLQFTTQCVVCKEFIPSNADYCNQCKSYQDKRRYFGYFSLSQTALALIVAVLAFLGSSLTAVNEFVHRDSETTIAFQGATADEITLTAMNTGRSPSLLRRYYLKSEDPNALERAELALIVDPKLLGNVVPANGGLTIRLRTNGLVTKLSDEQLREKVRALNMTVYVEVQESDRGKHTIRDTFPASGIELFIMKYTIRKKQART